MDSMRTYGPTRFTAAGLFQKSNFTISILNRRAARLVLRKSLDGTWKHPVSYVAPPYRMLALGVTIVGFSAESGMHIAIKTETV